MRGGSLEDKIDESLADDKAQVHVDEVNDTYDYQ